MVKPALTWEDRRDASIDRMNRLTRLLIYAIRSTNGLGVNEDARDVCDPVEGTTRISPDEEVWEELMDRTSLPYCLTAC